VSRFDATLAVTAALALGNPSGAPGQEPAAGDWQSFDIEEVRRLRVEDGAPWREFLRVSDLRAGLYELAAGAEDSQGPHKADEVYYVLEGRATLVVEDDRTDVAPGSVVYVAKGRSHHFVDITEDLSVLVFFATAGGS